MSPLVEVSYDVYLLGIRGPDPEVDPILAVHLNRVRAELLVELEVFAFFEEVDVVSGEKFMFDNRVHGRRSNRSRVPTLAKAYVSVRSVASAGSAIVTWKSVPSHLSA